MRLQSELSLQSSQTYIKSDAHWPHGVIVHGVLILLHLIYYIGEHPLKFVLLLYHINML